MPIATLAGMATLVLTVIGNDRAGLVNAVAEVVARHGGNWEQSQMAELAGKFAGIVLVTVPDGSSDDLVAALEPLHGLLDITAQLAGDEVTVPEPQRFTLDLVGADRPGIVRQITEVLAAHEIRSLEAGTPDFAFDDGSNIADEIESFLHSGNGGAGVVGGQVEALHEVPHQAHPMIRRDKLLQAHRPQFHLPALRHAQPRPDTATPLRRRRFRQILEQSVPTRTGHRAHTLKRPDMAEILTNRCRGDSRNRRRTQFIHRL